MLFILQTALIGAPQTGWLQLILVHLLDTDDLGQTADMHRGLPYALCRREHTVVLLAIISAVFSGHAGPTFGRWAPMW